MREGLRALGYPARGGALDPLLLRDRGALPRRRGSWRSASARSTASPPRTRRSRTSRCPGARASASRRTTSSSCCWSARARRSTAAGARRTGRSRRRQGGAEADARSIAIGALRYFLLKVGRNKVIAFDFDEALNFEGDTGPYLQYSLVRADNIFRKLEEKGIAARGVGGGPGRRRVGGRPLDDRPRRGLDPGGGRARGRDPRALDPGAARVRAGAELQPLLPPPADPAGADAAVAEPPDRDRAYFPAGDVARCSALLGIPEPGRM